MQYLLCVTVVLLVAVLCYGGAGFIGYRVVALLLLMAVSLLAMLFEIFPVLLAAVLSAFIWNFFFIPPLFTFHIASAEDALMFLLYFLIALVNAVLTFRIRKAEQVARDREEKATIIRLYQTLLNSLSHELRTPIATILGAADTLQENKVRLSSDQELSLIQEIDNAAVRLNRQVENLLSMSRLESGMLRPKADWCELEELISGVIRKNDLQHTHEIKFLGEQQLPLFRLDGGLLELILQNLIQNAVLYTPVGSLIQITATYTDQYLELKVMDSGKGFPEDKLELVFEKFYRLPDALPGGSGLGLSIVKGYTEAMGGTVTLHNQPEGGACFVIRLPVAISFLNRLSHE